MLQDGQEILEGRFQIVKKLGSGAFGEIYKGKHIGPFQITAQAHQKEKQRFQKGQTASWTLANGDNLTSKNAAEKIAVISLTDLVPYFELERANPRCKESNSI